MDLPFNWVDIAVVFVLWFGFTRGRKHGMSEELLLVMKWLAIIVAGGFLYATLGDMIADNAPFSHLASYTIAYFSIAIVIYVVFLGLKKVTHGKLLGAEVFGGAEYYLGMLAGIFRYSCILVFVFALINAPLYTKADIQANLNYQNEWYGSDFFPGFQTLQSQVFEKSFLGPYVRSALGFLLIKSTPFEKKGIQRHPEQDMPL